MLLPAFVICFLVSFSVFDIKVSGDEEKFLYFAYGSNLLARRIHINNPSAKFFASAMLPKYRLDFNIFMESWNGAVATIVEDPSSCVWGALWTLYISDMAHLDEQEGVNIGLYYAKNVSVVTREGNIYEARTYIETVDPPKVPSYALPPERQPSDTYKQVIIYGALECSLPISYIFYVSTFKSNGGSASWHIRESLGYPFNVNITY